MRENLVKTQMDPFFHPQLRGFVPCRCDHGGDNGRKKRPWKRPFPVAGPQVKSRVSNQKTCVNAVVLPVLLLGHDPAVERGQLDEAVERVVGELVVVAHLEVQLKKELDNARVQDHLLPRRARTQRGVLVGLKDRDELLWQVDVDERPGENGLGQGRETEDEVV
jgi:hypothetical protein